MPAPPRSGRQKLRAAPAVPCDGVALMPAGLPAKRKADFDFRLSLRTSRSARCPDVSLKCDQSLRLACTPTGRCRTGQAGQVACPSPGGPWRQRASQRRGMPLGDRFDLAVCPRQGWCQTVKPDPTSAPGCPRPARPGRRTARRHAHPPNAPRLYICARPSRMGWHGRHH